MVAQLPKALLKLHVIPRGSRNEVTGWRGDALCIKITAPPVEGAANAAIVKFVADKLGVRKSQVELVSGDKSREKTLRIIGLSDAEVRARIGG
ncbi:MAG: YggU family protein [Armatimonadetes bacterium]|jgi:uncharacterized protein (TIGR00251 family)|nr:YggU family protein [Armatimonadota bacterium]